MNPAQAPVRRPELRTALPGPRSAEVLRRDRAALATCYTRPFPLVPDRGQGVWLSDLDGNTFLDFMAGIAVSTTGYHHPHVAAAIADQVGRFLHICLTDYAQEGTTQLAERLLAHLPGDRYRAFFGNSGAEAVEAAIKLARHHTGRPYLISTLGSFHGRTYGAVSLTGSKANYRRGFGPLLSGVVHVPYPNPFRPPLGSNPESCGRAVLDYLERELFPTVLPPDEVAAILVEPMQGEGGYIVPPSDFLPGLRALCDRYGILLILDEVQTGMGRSGKMFAFEHDQIQPDMVTLAKGIASGLPLSAMLARERLMTWPEGSHGSTFGGNPVAVAAASATLDLLEGGALHPGLGTSLIDNARIQGEWMLAELRRLAADFPAVGQVRGRGLFLGIEFVSADGAEAPAVRDRFAEAAFRLGLLTLPCGYSSLRISPPLILNRQEAEVGLELIAAALRAVS